MIVYLFYTEHRLEAILEHSTSIMFFISVQKAQYHYFIDKIKSVKFSGTELEFLKIAIIKVSSADTTLEKIHNATIERNYDYKK